MDSRISLLTPTRTAAILGLGSGFMIIMAAVFEYGFGLHPCTMCYWQRIPHWLVIGLSVLCVAPILAVRIPLAAKISGRDFGRYIVMLMAAALLAGAAIAFWHAGVELKLLPGPTACSGGISLDGDASALLDQLLAAPVVRCDEVPWSLFGISMAGWNGLISFAMMMVAVMSVIASQPNTGKSNPTA